MSLDIIQHPLPTVPEGSQSSMQCCGAETIFFRSGSDFQKVSAPAPQPALATALELPAISDFMLRTFFMFFMKENRPNSHARSYSI
jgi:hypothetical protein